MSSDFVSRRIFWIGGTTEWIHHHIAARNINDVARRPAAERIPLVVWPLLLDTARN